MVIEQPLVLPHEVAHHPNSENSNDQQAGNEEPAVVHAGGMVNGLDELRSHSWWSYSFPFYALSKRTAPPSPFIGAPNFASIA